MKRTVVCLMIAIVVGSAAAGWWRNAQRLRATGGLHYVWQDGNDYVYRVSYHMTGHASSGTFYVPANKESALTPLEDGGDGLLRYTPVSRTSKDGTMLLVRWEHQNGNLQVAPFMLEMGAAGAPGAITFDGQSTPPERHRVRNLVALLQVHLPLKATSDWEARETDLNGVWSGRYKVALVAPDAITFTKSVHGEQIGAGFLRRRAMSSDIRFSRAGYLLEVQGQQSGQFLMGTWPMGDEKTNFSVAFLRTEPHQAARAGAVAVDVARFRENSLLSSIAGQDEYLNNRLATLRERVRNAPLNQVMGVFAAHPDGSVEQLLEASRRLEAYLELEPDAAARASVDALTHFNPDSGAFSSVATALTTAGNAAAQGALRKAMTRLDANMRAVRRLVPHLAMVRNPEVASEEHLRAITRTRAQEEVAATAAMGLGIMGNRLRQTSSERADRIFVEARAGLDAHSDDDLYLHILGNIGHERQAEVVRPYLRSDDTRLRQEAVSSLRFSEVPEARKLLLTAAAEDVSADVRARAVEALGHQTQDAATLDLYLSQLQSETSVPVLKEALRNLSTIMGTSTDAREAFQEFLKTCGHPDLCPYAKGLWSAAS